MQGYRAQALPAVAGMVVVAAFTAAFTVALTVLPIAAAHDVAAHKSGAAVAAVAPDAPWGASYFPNVPLVTQEGKVVRFFDDLIKDKVVAINFIYTACSDACPLETARLREVQQILGERVGRDVFFYSITIDPQHDTPAVLKHYAEKFKVGPGWLFLTGKASDITLLRKKLGLLDVNGEEDKSDKLNDHNLSLIVGNQSTGRWQKASPFENPHILATLLGSWLHNWKQVTTPRNDYASAPKLRRISRGEELFRTRCASCHTIRAAENSRASRPPVGPDLAGVTRLRDRSWLSRWLREPDRMLAEKDPLATALFAKYNSVAMPNLRLNDVEINALLNYLDEAGSQPSKALPPVRN